MKVHVTQSLLTPRMQLRSEVQSYGSSAGAFVSILGCCGYICVIRRGAPLTNQ